MSISLNISKINDNINKIAKEATDLVIVTKCLRLSEEIINSLNLGNHYVYDTCLDNLKLLKKLKKNLLFHYPYYKVIGSRSSHVIVSAIYELDKAMKDNVQNIYINFDLGDKREGFQMHEKKEILNYIGHQSKNHDFAIMSNIGCFKSRKPTKKYFDNLYGTKEWFIKRNIPITRLSIGGSNCLPFLKEQKIKLYDSEIRVGEAIFIGSIPYSNHNYDLNDNVAFLEANIIKKDKFLLANFGYNHIDKSCILGNDIKIVFQSSDISCLNFNNKILEENIKNKFFIPLNYKGLSRLSLINNIKYNLI